MMIIATILSFCSLIFVKINGESTILISRWIDSGNLSLDWSLQLNILTSSMVLMVNLVSTLIHIYSVGYMEKDPKKILFMAYLSLFTFFMLFLVSSSNLLQLFLGWEGVGLTSYLLIGFWNYKEKANTAALKAFIVNRVGDVGLLLALFTTFIVFGTLNISEIKVLINSQNESYFNFLGFDIHSISLISILLFILMFSSTSYAEWTIVSEDTSGNEFYLDYNRIRKVDGHVYYWALNDYLKPTKNGDLLSKLYVEGDCKIFRARSLSWSYYKEPMGRGTGQVTTPKTPEWVYYEPNSMGEKILNAICDHVK